MIHGEWFYKMDKRDRKVLEQIGSVDMDKIPNTGDAETEREDDIKNALDFLDEYVVVWENRTLNEWEEEFIDSLNNFRARGYRLTDKQFEKLLQIKVKYE